MIIDTQLLELIAAAILSCGCKREDFTILEGDVLVDDDNVRSALVHIQFKPFDSDAGRVAPAAITLQFDRQKNVGPVEGDDYCVMMTGDGVEREITPGGVFAAMYFNSLHPTSYTDGR